MPGDKSVSPLAGTAAYFVFVILAVLSLAAVRRRFFGGFYVSHVILGSLFIALAIAHTPSWRAALLLGSPALLVAADACSRVRCSRRVRILRIARHGGFARIELELALFADETAVNAAAMNGDKEQGDVAALSRNGEASKAGKHGASNVMHTAVHVLTSGGQVCRHV